MFYSVDFVVALVVADLFAKNRFYFAVHTHTHTYINTYNHKYSHNRHLTTGRRLRHYLYANTQSHTYRYTQRGNHKAQPHTHKHTHTPAHRCFVHSHVCTIKFQQYTRQGLCTWVNWICAAGHALGLAIGKRRQRGKKKESSKKLNKYLA